MYKHYSEHIVGKHLRGAEALSFQYSQHLSAGHQGKAQGKIGCWFCLTEWHEVGDHWEPLIVRAAEIDGVKIKADTWYTLKNKKFVEVK